MSNSNIRKLDWQKIFNIILLALSIGILIYFCISNNNLVTLINTLPSLNIFWFLCAILSMILSWFIDSLIIFKVTSSVYKKSYTKKDALKVTMVGQYFNAISPFAVLGQPMQIVTMIRQGVGSGLAFSILIQKFLIYQSSLTIYSLLVIIFKYGFFRSHFPGFMSLALIGFLCQSFIVILLILFSINRAFTTKVIKFVFSFLSKIHIVKNPEKTSKSLETQLQFYLNNNKSLNHNHRFALKLYLMTFTQLTLLFIVPFFVYKSYHNPGFPIVDMISAQAFVTMISSYTPLPGASGTSEGSFLVIFNLFFSDETTTQAMLLWRFITYYSCIIFGSFFAFFDKKKETININLNQLMNTSIEETRNS